MKTPNQQALRKKKLNEKQDQKTIRLILKLQEPEIVINRLIFDTETSGFNSRFDISTFASLVKGYKKKNNE